MFVWSWKIAPASLLHPVHVHNIGYASVFIVRPSSIYTNIDWLIWVGKSLKLASDVNTGISISTRRVNQPTRHISTFVYAGTHCITGFITFTFKKTWGFFLVLYCSPSARSGKSTHLAGSIKLLVKNTYMYKYDNRPMLRGKIHGHCSIETKIFNAQITKMMNLLQYYVMWSYDTWMDITIWPANSNNPKIQLCMTIVAVVCQIQSDLTIFIGGYVILCNPVLRHMNGYHHLTRHLR